MFSYIDEIFINIICFVFCLVENLSITSAILLLVLIVVLGIEFFMIPHFSAEVSFQLSHPKGGCDQSQFQ